MAHCIAVTSNAIRVQLPGGGLYAPAFNDAAVKIGARSGLAKKQATALAKLVAASIDVLNSGKASSITLEIVILDDSFETKVVGKGGGAPTKTAVKKLEALAGKRAHEFDYRATKTAHTIGFVV